MLAQFIYTILHLDIFLAQWTIQYGSWIYLLLFLIVFAETGLVLFPFLPGDSLLFALGALCALEGGGLNYWLVWSVLFFAAFLGDNVNYQVGHRIGDQIHNLRDGYIFNKKNLNKAHSFFQSHGALAIIMARFIPILRTFMPFTAGLGRMPYIKYISYSLTASFLWISTFLTAGFYFGNLTSVKKNFHLVILAVVLVSVLPLLGGVIRNFFNSPNKIKVKD